MDPQTADRIATAFERIATVFESLLAAINTDRAEDRAREDAREKRYNESEGGAPSAE